MSNIIVQVPQNADGTCPDVLVQFVPYVAPVAPPPAAKGNPVAAFTYASPTSNGTIIATDQSTDNGGTINTWTWMLDGVQVATAQNPTLTGVAAGAHQLALTVGDDTGQTNTSAPQTVTVPAVAPPPTNAEPNIGGMQPGDTFTPPDAGA